MVPPPPPLALPGVLPSLRAPGSRPFAAVCRPGPATTLPLLGGPDGKPVVAVRIDGRPATMQVDTGAQVTLLSSLGAARLGLAAGPVQVALQGPGQQAQAGTVTVASLVFAGRARSGLTVPVMRIDGLGTIDGLIGADLLGADRVRLDLPGRTITLYPAGCGGSTVPGRLPLIRGWLDGVAVTALVDTGGSLSVIDAASPAARHGPADQRTLAYGIGGAIAGRAHGYGMLTLGGVRFAAPRLRAVQLPAMLGADLLVGMDLLRGHVLWIDAAAGRAAIDP